MYRLTDYSCCMYRLTNYSCCMCVNPLTTHVVCVCWLTDYSCCLCWLTNCLCCMCVNPLSTHVVCVLVDRPGALPRVEEGPCVQQVPLP